MYVTAKKEITKSHRRIEQLTNYSFFCFFTLPKQSVSLTISILLKIFYAKKQVIQVI